MLITFSDQAINELQPGSTGFCPKATATVPAMTFSATFGPLEDMTVSGDPGLFVN